MANPPPATVTRKLRARFAMAGVMMLALWGASLAALFRSVDAYHVFMLAVATLTVLPLGLIMLSGSVSGSETGMRRAHMALFIAGGLLLLIASGEVIRRIVFGAGG